MVVLIGFGVIALGSTMYRKADALSSLQQRQAKAMRYPEGMRRQFTPTLTRCAGAGVAAMGVVWVIVGGFFVDKL